MPLNGLLRDLETQLKSLASNAFSTPQRVLVGHFVDERDELRRDPRLSVGRFAFQAPKEPKVVSIAQVGAGAGRGLRQK